MITYCIKQEELKLFSLNFVVRIDYCIQLFRERVLKKCARDNPEKVIWDMINTLFLTL